MFKNSVLLAISFIIISTAIFSSCERDKCATRGVDCKNSGTCFDGLCTCETGWIGAFCDTTANTPFVGKYGGILVSSPNSRKDPDTIKVRKGASNLEIIFRSIITSDPRPYRDSFDIKATIKSNRIFIENTVASNGFTYRGSGSVNKDLITLSYYKDSVGNNGLKYYSDTITFTGERTP